MPRPPRASTAVALAASAAALFPFFPLIAYAHPQNDDWVMAVMSIRLGFVGGVDNWFRTWSGRYFSVPVNLVTPLATGSIDGWRWAMAAYLLVLPLGIWALVAELAPRSARPLDRFAVAAGISALIHAAMPHPAPGLFWMNGVLCYGVGEGAALAAFAWTLRGARTEGLPGWGWTAAASVLAAAAVGTNEPIALLLVCSLAVAIAWAVAQRRPWIRIAVVLGVSAAGLAIVLLMPGTLARMEAHRPEGGRDILALGWEALGAAGRQALRFCATTPVLPVAFLLGLAAARARARDAGWRFPPPGVVVPVAAAAFLGTVFLPIYGEAKPLEYFVRGPGEIPPHVLNLAHAVFTGGALLSAVSVGVRAAQRGAAPAVPRWSIAAAALAAAALAVIPASALRSAWSDLATGRAARFDAAMLARYRIIAACGPVCEVPRIGDPPRTLVWFEDAVDEAADSWIFLLYKDSTYGGFFGKRRIRLPSAPAP